MFVCNSYHTEYYILLFLRCMSRAKAEAHSAMTTTDSGTVSYQIHYRLRWNLTNIYSYWSIRANICAPNEYSLHPYFFTIWHLATSSFHDSAIIQQPSPLLSHTPRAAFIMVALLFCTAKVPASVWFPLFPKLPCFKLAPSFKSATLQAYSYTTVKLLTWSYLRPQVINKLIEESIDKDEIPVEGYQMFSLVRNDNQEILDDPWTIPPIQDFTTSFEGKQRNYINWIICHKVLS